MPELTEPDPPPLGIPIHVIIPVGSDDNTETAVPTGVYPGNV